MGTFNQLKPTLKIWLNSQLSDPTVTALQRCYALCATQPLDATARGETSSLQQKTSIVQCLNHKTLTLGHLHLSGEDFDRQLQ